MIYNQNGIELQNVYNKDGNNLSIAYDRNGNIVFSQGEPVPPVVDYEDYSISFNPRFTIPLPSASTQGFAIYNGIVFQLMGNGSGTYNNRTWIYNMNTKETINENVPTQSGHGNSASFSSEFYDENDAFPLLYVVHFPTGGFYVNRVTENSSELIRNAVIDTTHTGLKVAGLALDEINDIVYLIGYTTTDEYSDPDETNNVIISKWDNSNVSEISGEYTPEYLGSFEIPFIYVMQGCTFHDGLIWVASGSLGNNTIYAIDPIAEEVVHTIPLNKSGECEGCQFLSDTELYFNMQGGAYHKITFAAS